MNPVLPITIISLLSIIAALFALWRGRILKQHREAWWILLALLIFDLFHDISNILEWSGITDSLDSIEDYSGLMLPVLFFLIAYVLLRAQDRKALQESEAMYSAIFDGVNDAVFLHDAGTGCIVSVNRRTCDLYGYSRDELSRLTVPDLSASDQPFDQAFLKMGVQGVREGAFPATEWHARDKSGREFWVEINPSMVVIGGRELLLVSVRDISVRKEAELALRMSEEKYRLVVETMVTGVQEIDVSGKILFVNSAFCRIVGYERDELVDTSMFDLLPSQEKEELSAYLQYLVDEQPKPKPWFGTNLRKDGTSISIQTDWDYKRNSHGDITGFVSILTDTTQRMKAEEVLRDSEEKARVLLDATTDMAMLINPEGNLVALNQAAAEGFNRTRAELIGKCPFEFASPEVTASRWKVFREIVASRKPVRFEDRNELKYFDNSMYPILDETGEVQMVALFAKDITERILAESSSRRREKYLSGLSEATQELLILSEGIPFQKFIDLLGPASKSSRAYIFLNHTGPDGSQMISQMAEWCAEGVSSEIDNPHMQDIGIDRWPKRWIDTLMRGEMLKGDIAEFPLDEREILEPQSIRAILMAPIIINEGFTGFIGLDICTDDRVHDDMDETFLRTASHDLAQAIRRSESDRQVHASLKEKEILLREVHHRVKNNLQVVTSLLSLQARRITDERAREALTDSNRRIRAMAMVHEALYNSSDLSHISMGKYFTRLIEEITSLHLRQEGTITFDVITDSLTLSITDAIPVGLIVNELLTNALKHAFPDGRKGTIQISLRKLENDEIELTVEDDGLGLPEDYEQISAETLGLQIVNSLVRIQLGGSISIDRESGTAFHIRFRSGSGPEDAPQSEGRPQDVKEVGRLLE